MFIVPRLMGHVVSKDTLPGKEHQNNVTVTKALGYEIFQQDRISLE